jgi:hypothetical protein
LAEIERGLREPEPEGLDYVKVGLGLVFGAFVFGILSPPGTLVISFGLMIPAVALLANALQEAKKRRALSSPPANRERELLSAIRNNGGSITPAEAAMETSLTVREADRMLSELAGGDTSPWRVRAVRCVILFRRGRRPSSTNPAPLPDRRGRPTPTLRLLAGLVST